MVIVSSAKHTSSRKEEEITVNEALKLAVDMANDERPDLVLSSIPSEKLRDVPNEICKLLANNGLSFQQAEMLLEVAKGRLRRAKI